MFTTQTDEEWNRIWQKRGRDYHEAGVRFPKAHEQEFGLFMRNMKLWPGMTVLEIAAAGGYVLERVRKKLGHHVKLLAIESSEVFAQFLPPYIERISDSTITAFNLPDESVDLVVNQSGLHHTQENEDFFEECFRVLKPQGMCGVCDVRKGSRVDIWLNQFVNQHHSQGHHGWFFEEGEITSKMKGAGFETVQEECVSYTWDFDSIEDMITFCRMLFGLDHASPGEILQGIEEILGFSRTPGSAVGMNWELIHAFGKKT